MTAAALAKDSKRKRDFARRLREEGDAAGGSSVRLEGLSATPSRGGGNGGDEAGDDEDAGTLREVADEIESLNDQEVAMRAKLKEVLQENKVRSLGAGAAEQIAAMCRG